MLKLGPEKNPDLKDRMTFVLGSLESPRWLKSVDENFDAVISARALHHFTENQRRRDIFKSCSAWCAPAAVSSMAITFAVCRKV